MMNSTHTQRGFSLLIVLLVSSLILVAATSFGAVALRLVQTSTIRLDALQAQYAAESAFWCAKYWASVHPEYLDDAPNPISCNAVTFTPTVTSQTSATTTMTFTSQIGATGARGTVRIERSRPNSTNFSGRMASMGYGSDPTSVRAVEQYQEYEFAPSLAITRADIVFAIDNSVSISDPANNGSVAEWQQMYDGIYEVVDEIFSAPGSDVRISISPFPGEGNTGNVEIPDLLTDVTGDTVPACATYSPLPPCASLIYLRPRMGLSDVRLDVLNEITAERNNVRGMRTHIELGLAVAASELMGKHYPWSIAPVACTPLGACPGDFEQIAQTVGASFDALPDQVSPFDRDDTLYPDYIFLVSDGVPNVVTENNGNPRIIGFNTNEKWTEPNGVGDVVRSNGRCGDYGTILYPETFDDGYYNNVNFDITQPATYPFAGSMANYGTWEVTASSFCFTERVSDAIKDPARDPSGVGIQIAALFIGDQAEKPNQVGYQWMQDRIVSRDTNGVPIVGNVSTFDQTGVGLRTLIGGETLARMKAWR